MPEQSVNHIHNIQMGLPQKRVKKTLYFIRIFFLSTDTYLEHKNWKLPWTYLVHIWVEWSFGCFLTPFFLVCTVWTVSHSCQTPGRLTDSPGSHSLNQPPVVLHRADARQRGAAPYGHALTWYKLQWEVCVCVVHRLFIDPAISVCHHSLVCHSTCQREHATRHIFVKEQSRKVNSWTFNIKRDWSLQV